MDQSQLFGIVRAVLAAIGGFLVSKGLVDDATATALAGAFTTILVGVWSVLSKRSKS